MILNLIYYLKKIIDKVNKLLYTSVENENHYRCLYTRTYFLYLNENHFQLNS